MKEDIKQSKATTWWEKLFNTTNLILLFVALVLMIFGFFLFFKGFHEVDLFVNRLILFDALNKDFGLGLNIDSGNETGFNLYTGETITITNFDLYNFGIRNMFLGILFVFAATALFSSALTSLISKFSKKNDTY